MGKVITVKTVNLDKLLHKMDAMAKNVDLTEAVNNSTMKVWREARIVCPVNKKRGKTAGGLRDSIQPVIYNQTGVVYTDMEYAAPVHFGHLVMGGSDHKTPLWFYPARPFLTDGVRLSSKYIKKQIEKAIIKHNKEAIR